MSNHPTDLETYSQRFKALANPHRLAIFRQLMEQCCGPNPACEPGGAACVGDLAKDLAIAPSTLSHHLKELRQAGLLRMDRRGKYIDCHVEDSILTEMAGFFKPSAELVQVRGPA